MEVKMTTAIEYLNLIDQKYLEARKSRISRFSVEWGRWSRTMNTVITARIKDIKDADKVKLSYVFIYWTMMSQLLELHYKFKLLKRKEKKRLFGESEDIKEIIITGNGLQPLSEDDLKIALLKGLK